MDYLPLIFVSNTETLMSRSKERVDISSFATRSNSVTLPMTWMEKFNVNNWNC